MRHLARIWLGIIALVMGLPFIIVVVASFNSSKISAFPPSGWTVEWYTAALSHRGFQDSFVLSIIVAALASTLAVVIGAMAALALSRMAGRNRDVLRTLFVGPMAMPRVALGFSSFVLFLLLAAALPSVPGLVDSPISLVLVHAIVGTPVVLAIVSAALTQLDVQLEEAAATMGAGRLRALVQVVLPQVWPAVISAWFFAFLLSFDDVEAAIFLKPFAGETLPVVMFNFLETRTDPTLAAISTILMLLTLVMALVGWMLFQKGSRKARNHSSSNAMPSVLIGGKGSLSG